MSSQRQTRSSARLSQRTSARLASMAASPLPDAELDYEPEHDDAWPGQGLRRSSRRISSRIQAAEQESLPRRSLRSAGPVGKAPESKSDSKPTASRRRSNRLGANAAPPSKSRKVAVSDEEDDEEEEDPELANLVDAAAAPSDSNDGSFEEDGDEDEDDDDDDSSSESEEDSDGGSDSEARYSRRRRRFDRGARRQAKRSRQKRRSEHKYAVKQKMKPSKDCLPEDPLWEAEPTYTQPEPAAELVQNDPAVAFIIIYTTKFASVFVGIDPIGPQDIEEGLEKGHGQTELLFRRILGLCLNRKKELEPEKYLSAMNELHTLITHIGKPARLPDDLPWKSKTIWQDISPMQRLSLLFGLFQLSLASSQQVQALLGELNEDDMQPWFGVDNENSRYYFVQGNGDTPFRLYKESSPLLRTVRWESVAGSHSEASTLGKRLCESGDDAEKEIGQYIIELLPYLEETEDRRYKELRKQRRRHDIELQVEQVRAGEGRYSGRTRGARVDYSMKTYERDLDRAIHHRSSRRSSARVAARDDGDSNYMAESPRIHGIRQSRRVRGEVPMDLDAPSYQELQAEEEAKKIAEAEEAERQEQQRLEEKRLRKEAMQQKRAANKEKAAQKGAANAAAQSNISQIHDEQQPRSSTNPFTILRDPSSTDDRPVSPRSVVPAPSQAMPGLRPNRIFDRASNSGPVSQPSERPYVPQHQPALPLNRMANQYLPQHLNQPTQQPQPQPLQHRLVPQLPLHGQSVPGQGIQQLSPMQPMQSQGTDGPQQAIPSFVYGVPQTFNPLPGSPGLSMASQSTHGSMSPSTVSPPSGPHYLTQVPAQNATTASTSLDSQTSPPQTAPRLPPIQAIANQEIQSQTPSHHQVVPIPLRQIHVPVPQPAAATNSADTLQTTPPLDVVRAVTPPVAIEPVVASAMPLPTPPIPANTLAVQLLVNNEGPQEVQFFAQPSPLPSHRPTPEAEELAFTREQQ